MDWLENPCYSYHSTLGKIKLKDIRVYAYHGCLVEESHIGSDYIVNLEVKANLSQASQTDALADTVDYVHLQKIVRKEMAIPSKLLEHVAKRIIDTVLEEVPMVDKIEISVSKRNPPIGGDVAEVSVTMKGSR